MHEGCRCGPCTPCARMDQEIAVHGGKNQGRNGCRKQCTVRDVLLTQCLSVYILGAPPLPLHCPRNLWGRRGGGAEGGQRGEDALQLHPALRLRPCYVVGSRDHVEPILT